MSEEIKEEPPQKSFFQKYRAMIWFTIALVITGMLVFALWFFYLRFRENTDDAYVDGNKVYLTPQIPGIITSIYADETDLVLEGQLLIQLDPTDWTIAFNESKAALAETVREVSQMFDRVYQLAALYERERVNLANYEIQYLNRKAVIDSGAVSEEDYTDAATKLLGSTASLNAIKYDLMGALALVQGTSVENHPLTERAKDRVRQSWVNLQRCTLSAPAAGIIAMRRAQVGESVSPSTPLLAIIPLDQMWVYANFKEVELTHVRIGQPVTMTADIYGRDVIYTGEVNGIGGGTGAVFSPLPPQNATGNWIKIVQRVPVRVNLDKDQLFQNPLRLGLSMNVHVDIKDREGARIPEPLKPEKLYATDLFARQVKGSEEVIQQILKENIFIDLELSYNLDEILEGAHVAR